MPKDNENLEQQMSSFCYEDNYSIEQPGGRNHNSLGKTELDGCFFQSALRGEAMEGRNQMELLLQ